MAGATIPLSRTYNETGSAFAELVFREPRWQDFIDLGHIEEWQPLDLASDGTPTRSMLVRHHDVVAQYAERCLQVPRSASDLAVLDLADTLAVHDAIRGFFASARSSRTAPIASSGDTAKASTMSGG